MNEVKISNAVCSRARSFINDESAMKCERGYLGSISLITSPIAYEVRSWIETPEARSKTLRYALTIAAAQLTLM